MTTIDTVDTLTVEELTVEDLIVTDETVENLTVEELTVEELTVAEYARVEGMLTVEGDVRSKQDLVAEDSLHVYSDAHVYKMLFADNLKGQMKYLAPPTVTLDPKCLNTCAIRQFADYFAELTARLIKLGVMAPATEEN